MSSITHRIKPAMVFVALLGLAFSGCESDPVISEYTAPRDNNLRPFSCTIPPAWKQASNDRFSKLAFESPTGTRVTVTSLAGTGDEFLLVNVNRWRRQIALGPVENLDDVSTIKLGKGDARLVELVGQSKALTGAIVEHSGKTWFFKLSGTVAGVSDQSDEFSEFLQSVEFYKSRS